MYDVLMADPPWQYAAWNGKQSRTSDAHYQTLSLAQICNINVPDITGKNSALFLWVTPPCLDWGMQVMAAWKFRYRTVAFTWVKHNKTRCEPNQYPVTVCKVNHAMGCHEAFGLSTGMGHYTRANVELCLLGIRGRMTVPPDRRPQSVVTSPRLGHSVKPLEVQARIGFMYPNHKKLEMFSRTRVSGWDAWGDQAPSPVDLPLEVPAP